MPLKSGHINKFIFFKLPSAFFCGVRVKSISNESCVSTVKFRWINQNPFNSIYWAVQGMAAELSTGALVMTHIRDSKQNISMLVANNKGTFTKKARGRIKFTCNDGHLIKDIIDAAISSGEGQTCWMKSEGVDSNGDLISTFEFEWTIKLKS